MYPFFRKTDGPLEIFHLFLTGSVSVVRVNQAFSFPPPDLVEADPDGQLRQLDEGQDGDADVEREVAAEIGLGPI
jgi:hypothetical protein